MLSVVPIFLSIPNYISLDIVSSEVPMNRTNGVMDADGNLLFVSENVTKYVINFSELAMANDRLLYRDQKHKNFLS